MTCEADGSSGVTHETTRADSSSVEVRGCAWPPMAMVAGTDTPAKPQEADSAGKAPGVVMRRRVPPARGPDTGSMLAEKEVSAVVTTHGAPARTHSLRPGRAV